MKNNEMRTDDLWNYLVRTEKKILLYGMGNGAEKILAVCEKKGVRIADFFASNDFVRGHFFKGKKVLSFSEAKERYGAENIIVLLSFATRLESVLQNILNIAAECELYAPDVPVCGDFFFDYDFFLKHKEDISLAKNLFREDFSRALYEDIIKYKLSGKIDYLLRGCSEKKDFYSLITAEKEIRQVADFGAYDGDTIREAKRFFPEIRRIIALEPDPKNYKKLSAFVEERIKNKPVPEIIPLCAAAWEEDGSIIMESGGSRNSGIMGFAAPTFPHAGVRLAKKSEKEIPARSGDSIFEEYQIIPDYIKFDVEGSEFPALLGCRKTIQTHAPTLAVSVYHRSEDIFFLPRIISRMQPEYDMYLRRSRCLPAWEITLLCIKK